LTNAPKFAIISSEE